MSETKRTFVDKLKNPSPEVLAKVEYRSHFMQILGVLTVCIILLLRGFWYIIFALVFSVGVSYAQGMSSFQKYQAISKLMGKPIEEEKSPTRRIDKVIKAVFGNKASWFTVVVSALLPYFILPDVHFVLYSIAYLLTIILIYAILYYFIIYWISYPIYKFMKGGAKNDR